MQISVLKIWCAFGCLGLLPLSVFAMILTKVTTSNVVYTGWNIPLSLVFELKCDVCHLRSRLLRGYFKRQAVTNSGGGRGGSCIKLWLSNSVDNNPRFLQATGIGGFIGSTNAMEDPSSKFFFKELGKVFQFPHFRQNKTKSKCPGFDIRYLYIINPVRPIYHTIDYSVKESDMLNYLL